MKKNYFVFCFFFILSIVQLSVYAQEKALQPFGVNLAGAEFGKQSGVYDKDYSYPTPANLDYFKSKGLLLVRLPFKWERMQPELNGDLNQDELSHLENVLDEAFKRGMIIIPDLHSYGRRIVDEKSLIIGEEGLPIESFADFWRKLAFELKDYKNIYGYGIMNEPHDMLSSTPWAKIVQSCILEIRKSDSHTTIIVGGDSWSSAERWPTVSDDLKNLYDPANKLIFEAHVYFDDDASGIYRKSYHEENANPYKGIERVQPFIKWLKDNNAKGFIGEFGVPDNDDHWLVCLDYFLAYLQMKGINATYWAAGPRWNKYPLSIQDNNGEDRPQMKIVQKYLWTK